MLSLKVDDIIASEHGHHRQAHDMRNVAVDDVSKVEVAATENVGSDEEKACHGSRATTSIAIGRSEVEPARVIHGG